MGWWSGDYELGECAGGGGGGGGDCELDPNFFIVFDLFCNHVVIKISFSDQKKKFYMWKRYFAAKEVVSIEVVLEWRLFPEFEV